MRAGLRDALADSELFLTQVSIPRKENRASCPQYHRYNSKYHASPSLLKTCSSRITDMTDTFYYTGYIRSTYIERIQVNLGSSLSIIPKRLLHFLGMPLSRLSTTTTTIYGFNARVVILWERSVSSAKLET